MHIANHHVMGLTICATENNTRTGYLIIGENVLAWGWMWHCGSENNFNGFPSTQDSLCKFAPCDFKTSLALWIKRQEYDRKLQLTDVFTYSKHLPGDTKAWKGC